MRRQTATARIVTSATPEAIWSLVADLSRWTTWAPFETATLEREGPPRPRETGEGAACSGRGADALWNRQHGIPGDL